MSKGVQIAIGALLVVGLVGWLGASQGRDEAFAYFQTLAEFKGQRATDSDTFAVQQPVGITRRRLERVAEGVTEVQQGALAFLGLVPRDDARHHGD